ncbi:hypothetical protein Tco_1226562 [Tanacetum coccineum]
MISFHSSYKSIVCPKTSSRSSSSNELSPTRNQDQIDYLTSSIGGGGIANDGASRYGGGESEMGVVLRGSGEDHGESGDDGRVDIARSLATSASDHTGVGTGAGIEILVVTRYAWCGGGVAADSSVSNGSVS